MIWINLFAVATRAGRFRRPLVSASFRSSMLPPFFSAKNAFNYESGADEFTRRNVAWMSSHLAAGSPERVSPQ